MTTAGASLIEADTRALALPHGRRVGQPGHETARRYLLERLTEIGLEPFAGDGFEIPYEGWTPIGNQQFTNLVGVAPGRDRSLPPFLVGAHYDSVIDAPCADDNATAVAVALAVAETVAESPLRRDVIVALFDAEEPPHFLGPNMGSIRFHADHARDIDFRCVFIMDLIGHDVELGDPRLDGAIPGLADLLFVLGSESQTDLPPAVERAAGVADSLRVIPTLNEYIGDMSDHHAFRLAGQPYLFLSCGQGRHYHTPADDMEWVNLEKVRAVYRYLLALLEELDGPGSGPDAGELGPAPDSDQAAFEIRMIESALGSDGLAALQALGLPSLRSRSDLDQLAALLSRGLVV
jgi:hypothetical protein